MDGAAMEGEYTRRGTSPRPTAGYKPPPYGGVQAPALLFGVAPGVAHADFCDERDSEGHDGLHAVLHDLHRRFDLVDRRLEHQFVVHLDQHLRARRFVAETFVDRE